MKKRKMSTYLAPSRFDPQKIHTKEFHIFSVLLGKKKSKRPRLCKEIKDICVKESQKGCLKTCDRKPSASLDECYAKVDKCHSRDLKKRPKKGKKKKKKDCFESCIPPGKCDMPQVPRPPKMVYGPAVCPPPKFVSPKPCPDMPEQLVEPCVEIRPVRKREICVPPPLPKPPTDPVVLCPCPPPPKLHPGDCPCYDLKVEKKTKPTLPPCKPKEPYVCPREPHYCPPESLVCKMQKPCQEKIEKRKEKKIRDEKTNLFSDRSK